MRILFFGNPDFSVPGFKAILGSSHTIVGAVTNPPKSSGRGRRLQPTPVDIAATERGIPVIHATDLRDRGLIEQIAGLNADIFAVIAYRILPNELLKTARIGAVNLHTSLLPKYRGAAPIQRALMNGETETGVTIFLIEPKVDTGDIILQEACAIREEDDFGSLSEKLNSIGSRLLVDAIGLLETGRARPVPQENSHATSAPKIGLNDCVIQWERGAKGIRNQIKALSPAPGAYTNLHGTRIKIFDAAVAEEFPGGKRPGEIVMVSKTQCVVQTGQGSLDLKVVQREGKKRLKIQQFLLGSVIKPGDFFQ